ncbi:hypothetical protein FPQ18DRAFT_313902 [Pyronema domesticum]|uniref:Uncharacterized protein n=1 Tax=Pyronema omphalodes (strain CBS 100304) TaxID=1076935 RepID=U4LSF4_PYROM|nr:hypothetical protein FPQ18DRAFT_313902 [Pyronema domesticum]CCX32265.1 Similar to hypothetical protein [Tuber melanosporum Mel28]; acc. no. XP_002839990 [Pyronema omphalodes CBS 100304]
MAPHAETGSPVRSRSSTGNGSAPNSPSLKSFEHLKSFPVVADGINTFSSHPIGQKTIALSTSAYSRFIAPLSPYLSMTYPYVNKADDLADSGLGAVETRFPIVKESTENIKTVIIDSVGYPRKVVAEVIVRGQDFAKEKQQYVFKVYEDEFSRIAGDESSGYIPMAKAGVTSAFVVSSELMGAIANYLGSKKENVKQATKQAKPTNNGKNGQY